MTLDVYRISNRILVAGLTVAVLVTGIFAVLAITHSSRQMELSEVASEAGADLRDNVKAFQITSEQIQEQIEELRKTAHDDPESAARIRELESQIDVVNAQLENLEENVDWVTAILEEETAVSPESATASQTRPLVVAAAWLVSALSVVTAFVLAVLLNTRTKKRKMRFQSDQLNPDTAHL